MQALVHGTGGDSVKDYALKAVYLDKGQPTLVQVCATDAIDAISECWQKLPTNRHEQVDTFEIVTIEMCEHKKGVIV